MAQPAGLGIKCGQTVEVIAGMLMLDRILFTATHYPVNYGFVPRSYGDDKDPLDILVLCSEAIEPMTLVRSYPIGVIKMEDSSMGDEKIIAIPCGDPAYRGDLGQIKGA